LTVRATSPRGNFKMELFPKHQYTSDMGGRQDYFRRPGLVWDIGSPWPGVFEMMKNTTKQKKKNTKTKKKKKTRTQQTPTPPPPLFFFFFFGGGVGWGGGGCFGVGFVGFFLVLPSQEMFSTSCSFFAMIRPLLSCSS